MPHSCEDLLPEIGKLWRDAWTRYQNGRASIARNLGKLGDHTGREINWSDSNGWHYHHHQLRYDKPGTYSAEKDRADWLSALDYVGRASSGVERRAFDCGIVGDEAGARYVAKLSTSVEAQARAIGSELTSSVTKGRNFNTLLRAAAGGDFEAESTWYEGAVFVTSAKISSVRWSRNFRERVGMSDDKSDEIVARETVTEQDELLGSLTSHQWTGVLKFQAEFALCCAAQQGRVSVNNFLSGLELGQLCDDPTTFHRPSGRWV
jgi:hypothetical protein